MLPALGDKDHPAAKEADSNSHGLDDADRIGPETALVPGVVPDCEVAQNGEQRGGDADQHVSTEACRLVSGLPLPAEYRSKGTSYEQSNQERQLVLRCQFHFGMEPGYAAWEDQRVERQWPHATGLVLSSVGSAVGYVMVKLNPQLRHRSVTVTELS